MLFDGKQIREILSIIDFRFADLVWKIFGPSQLSNEDRRTLRKFGVDPSKFKDMIPPYWQNWMFGLLSGLLKNYEAKQITYDDFVSYLKNKQYIKPSSQEVEMYNIACNRTYGYLKGLGDKTKKDITSYITDADLRMRMEQEKVIQGAIKEGVLKRQTSRIIASRIANQLDDWNRDWNRIVETEFQSVFNMGRAQSFMRKGGSGKVWFEVFPGACQSCIQLYLTAGIGSKPKLFDIAELIANGSNVGRKRADWKPTLYGVHPFCRCLVMNYIEGDEWDEKEGKFVAKPGYERRVAPKAKVKITVGDKVFYA